MNSHVSLLIANAIQIICAKYATISSFLRYFSSLFCLITSSLIYTLLLSFAALCFAPMYFVCSKRTCFFPGRAEKNSIGITIYL